jgi:hypothetical protein
METTPARALRTGSILIATRPLLAPLTVPETNTGEKLRRVARALRGRWRATRRLVSVRVRTLGALRALDVAESVDTLALDAEAGAPGT